MTRSILVQAFALFIATAFGGCSDNDNFDVSTQIGPDPVLPAPSASLIPDVKVAEVVGWREGQSP